MIWDFLQYIAALFIIMDPLANLPIFWHFSLGLSDDTRHRMANRVIVIAGIVLLLFLFLGLKILALFGIAFTSFKIAGGIVLLILGVRIIGWQHAHEERLKNYHDAIVPIAVPLLVGPGAITTVIIFTSKLGYLITFAGAMSVLLVSWLIFFNARRVMSIFGREGSEAISRVMALLIIAFAVQFIRDGLLG